MSARTRILPLAGATMLAGLSALHLTWATGSSFPASDGRRLAELVAGTADVPSAHACVVMGVGLGAASALVAGVGGDRRVARCGRRAVAAGFLARGLAGLTGNTHRLVPWTPAATFVRLDRRYYGPLCLAVAAAAVSSRSVSRQPSSRA
jgi:hypothetical protein